MDQPSLDELASALGYSPSHIQRVFQDWVGISPKAFLQYLTVDYAKARLAEADSVMEAAYASGLSGPGRLHDHFVKIEAMTPGEYKQGGAGVTVRWGIFPSPFGDALLAGSERGLSFLGFVDAGQMDRALDDLMGRWPRADFVEDSPFVEGWWQSIFPQHGQQTGPCETVPVFVRGTPFQVQVWEGLLRIPEGQLCPYGKLAEMVGNPKGSRAVGSAVGANPISYLIPCHRVIQKMGVIGNYHWGRVRKKALIGYEASGRQRRLTA